MTDNDFSATGEDSTIIWIVGIIIAIVMAFISFSRMMS